MLHTVEIQRLIFQVEDIASTADKAERPLTDSETQHIDDLLNQITELKRHELSTHGYTGG